MEPHPDTSTKKAATLREQWSQLGNQPPAQAEQHQPAGLAARAYAYLIDRVIIYGITIPVSIVLAWDVISGWAEKLLEEGAAEMETLELLGRAFQILDAGGLAELMVVTLAVFMATSAAYTIPSHAVWGRTLGKKLLRLRVRLVAEKQETGPRGGIGWWPALKRWATPAVAIAAGGYSVIATGAVYGWVLTNPWRRGIHDVIGGTWVVTSGPDTDVRASTEEE